MVQTVLFYKSFSTSYSYTKIGRVSNLDYIELVIGQTSVLISFKYEKGEENYESYINKWKLNNYRHNRICT